MSNAVPPPVMVPPRGTVVASPLAPAPVYIAPRSSRLPAFIGYWLAYAVMLLMPAGLFIYAMYVWVPAAREVVKDFKILGSPLTQWLLDMSATAHTVTFWVEVGLSVGLLSLVLAAVTALMPRGFSRASIAMISMLVVLGLTVAESVLLYAAIWQPILKAVRGAAGNP